MIRRSVFIALFALLLSLGFHLVGLGVAVRVERTSPPPETTGEVVAVGNAFEDIAEALQEPEEPELAPEPEQEETVEPVPPVNESEVPDTEVLVASENPQDTFAPDTGTAQIVEPVPLAGTQSDFVPDPDISEPTAKPDETDPVPPQSDTSEPLGPKTDIEQIESSVALTETTPPVAAEATEATEPVEEVIASLPVTLLPVEPGIQLSVPEAEIVKEAEPIEPTESGTAEPIEDSNEAEQQPLFPSWRNGFEDLRAPSQTIESPLETFRRDGSLAAVGGFGIQSGSAANSRGPGNSNTTNYAGRVLVHLNRTRAVYAKTPGFSRVFFEINSDGSLNWIEIIDSSGSADVDRAARVQIQSAAPFPIPPNGTSRQLSFWYRSR